ncbi:hypothetical protein [Georgenia thermotolerans]|uniref:Uncharacterized protein n=1 Tax=Georgenia thermotolerans TaxID=527326 RepID=A0A7J5UIH2_9MICO|nr:hypothetical protein [Georgenia thermotolerans]KAE8762179.1 hypothetical protein GB883_20715 [Georgenia thermotolerans]
MRAAASAFVAALTVLAGLVLAAPARATHDVDATTGAPAAGPGVPAEVAEWFRAEGPNAVIAGAAQLPELTPQQRGEVRVGPVRTVMTWSDGLLTGADLTPAVQPASPEEWVAPLELGEAAVGVLLAGREGAGRQLHAEVRGDADLGEAVRGLDLSTPLVHDEPLDGWFAVADGEVRPLDAAARDALAGAAPVEVYQPLVQQRYDRYRAAASAEPGSAAEQARAGGSGAVVWVAGIVVVLLVWAGVIVWLRRPEEAPRTVRPRERHPRRGVRR